MRDASDGVLGCCIQREDGGCGMGTGVDAFGCDRAGFILWIFRRQGIAGRSSPFFLSSRNLVY